jgi:hypothetical protein
VLQAARKCKNPLEFSSGFLIFIEIEKCVKHFSTATRCKATNFTPTQSEYHLPAGQISLGEAEYHGMMQSIIPTPSVP